MNVPQEFHRLFNAARRLQSEHRAAALATLTRTAGSTYRRAGTSMLVDPDGNVTCPLAGGCPQHDLVERALHAIASDRPVLACYNRDESLDVLIETGCGGELEALIEPLSRPRDFKFLDALASLHARRNPGFLATVYARAGRVLAPRPQRMVAGEGIGWNDIADDALRDRIAHAGRDLARSENAVVRELGVDQSSCLVLFEPLQPVHRLVIFGANAGAQALARLGVLLGWDCVLAATIPIVDEVAGVRYLRCMPETICESMAFDAWTSAIAMTHNLEQDLRFLHALADTRLAYTGVIGSRQRAAWIRARLPVAMDLRAPAGLDIASETPEEIALSVAAEILAVSHARTARNLVASAKPIHA